MPDANAPQMSLEVLIATIQDASMTLTAKSPIAIVSITQEPTLQDIAFADQDSLDQTVRHNRHVTALQETCAPTTGCAHALLHEVEICVISSTLRNVKASPFESPTTLMPNKFNK